MVGGLRERDYQLSAQRRNDARRRLDNNFETARYFERESRLAEHFSSWITRESNVEYVGLSSAFKSRLDKLTRRRKSLKKLLNDEDEFYKTEIERRIKNKINKNPKNVDELRRNKLTAIRRTENCLYYPQNYRSNLWSSPPPPSSSRSSSLHYHTEVDIDASRKSAATLIMEDPNNQKNHPSEKRHYTDHTTESEDSFGDAFHEQVKHTGERRHYVTQTDSIDEGSNPSQRRIDAGSSVALYSGTRRGNMPDISLGSSSHTVTSERRHYTASSADSFRSLANTNMREVRVRGNEEDFELNIEAEDRADAEAEAAAIREEKGEEEEEQRAEERYRRESNGGGGGDYEDRNEQEDGWSMAGGNMRPSSQPQKEEEEEGKRFPICFTAHSELVQRIQDLATRELQACKKQNWSEALRFRDMRNRLELQREIEVFQRDDLGIDENTRRGELEKISGRIRLMDKREAVDHQRRVYSEEARTAWQLREREDDEILSKEERAKRDILLNELENEWEDIASRDKDRVAESPVKASKSHLQEEMEITAAAMERATLAATPQYHASNEDSKNSCMRNKDKAGSSLIFLG